MKTTFAVLAVAGFVAAQELADLPQCGQVCISNMITIATEQFNCGNGNASCYCVEPNFSRGIRDCSNESCMDDSDAAAVIEYGSNYCANTNAADNDNSAASSILTGGSSSTTMAMVSTMFTTITSDGETMTSAVTTSTMSDMDAASTVSDASPVTSSVASAVDPAVSSASDAVDSATEEGAAAAQTAAPFLLGAAALAALAL